MRWRDKETVESAFLFSPAYSNLWKFPQPNCVSLRPEIKEGLIYYLIAKYMVTSRCKEQPTHQLQKANSTFLVVRLGIKIFCYQVCAFVWMVWRCYRKCYFFELSNRRNEIFFSCLFYWSIVDLRKVKLEISSVFFNLYKCQSTDISENRTINQLDPRNTNKIKFS